MFKLLRSAMVLATASITAAVLVAPGTAFAADTTTKLSAAGMAAELKAVSVTTAAAAKNGWRATMRFTAPDLPASAQFVVDPSGGVASSRDTFAGETTVSYVVAGKGVYASIEDLTSRAAVKMMGRPSVRYSFTSQAVKLDAYVRQSMPVPAMLLIKDVNHAGTKTSHEDGSRDYAFKDRDTVPVMFRVGPAGVLSSVRLGSGAVTMTVAYTYGPQQVVLPAASVTVDSKTLARAVAYLSMPASVKNLANQAAAHTRSAAKGKPVQITSLRRIVRRDAAACNRAFGLTMLKVGDITGGARVSATNPWTHLTVSYTVKASGSKVLVTKS
jgi:hypothetical protein